ncbi:uncharacterized protein LOC133249978 isoform X3 [Bos javanicus]|uniref:uncharacterized protein LOC133249978 isoform X3 n=1 Tax=Bos javanicus TaxID=9906 RepID=UPI002AA7E133|nr:uncharacterized protein LOC133249978 isoform X3 [Bos javanicus]
MWRRIEESGTRRWPLAWAICSSDPAGWRARTRVGGAVLDPGATIRGHCLPTLLFRTHTHGEGFQEAPEVEEEALQLSNPRLLPPQVLGVFLWRLPLPLQLFQPLLSEGRASLSPSGENSPEDQDTSALEEPAKPGPRPAVSRPTAHQYLSTETHQGDHTLHGSKHRPRDAGASEPVSQERSHHQSLQRQPPTRPPRWKAEARRGQGSRVGPDWVRTPCFSGCRWLSRPHFPVSRQPHRVIELLLGVRGYWSRPFPFWGSGRHRGIREPAGAKVAWRLWEGSEAGLLTLCRLWALLLGGVRRGGAHTDRNEIFLFHQVAAPSSQLPWAEQRHRGHRQTRTQVSSWESSGLGFRPACGKGPE